MATDGRGDCEVVEAVAVTRLAQFGAGRTNRWARSMARNRSPCVTRQLHSVRLTRGLDRSAELCRAGVTCSRLRPTSEARLLKPIRASFNTSNGIYGSPRVCLGLTQDQRESHRRRLCGTSAEPLRNARIRVSKQSVFVFARQSAPSGRYSAGLLRDSGVFSCARRLQRPSDLQVFDSLTAQQNQTLAITPCLRSSRPIRSLRSYKANVGGSIPSAPTIKSLKT